MKNKDSYENIFVDEDTEEISEWIKKGLIFCSDAELAA